MRILFLTNLLPYPLDNGGKIKTYNILETLSEKGDIDLFCYYENDDELKYEKELKTICKSINYFKKPLTTNNNISYMKKVAAKSLISKLPMTVFKYYDDKMKEKLSEYIECNNYDYIYIDHLQLAVYIDLFLSNKSKIILDQHNCESVIMKRRFDKEKSFLKKMFFYFEYMKLKSFEKKCLNIVNRVIVLSEEDKKEMIKISKAPSDKFYIIPIPVTIDYVKNRNTKVKDKIKLLFLGTMSWYPNSHGILWFLKQVIPLMNQKYIDYELYIVGKSPGKDIIEESRKYDNIHITGYVNDTNDYIEICDAMVVPLFIGSGMRVKILEALGKALPIITTQIGLEGIKAQDEKEILIANNAVEFIKCIQKLYNEEMYNNLQTNGLELFNKQYSTTHIKSLVHKYLFS